MSFFGRDVISIQDFSKTEILEILKVAQEMKKNPNQDLLKGCLIGSCFFEASTRTRLSFEAAVKRLGGDIIGFADANVTSTKKGETLSDSIKIISSYVDAIVIRHPQNGSAKLAADVSDKPVINAGDGSNEHPTQTLLDLFSIKECQGTLDGLKIILAGDLKYGRTVHSLSLALMKFNCELFFVSPESLNMPETICTQLKNAGLKISHHSSLDEVIDQADILYMTRIQEERFTDPLEFKKVAKYFCVNLKLLEKAKQHLKVLHPLPRVSEIAEEVDNSPFAYYFIQAQNGVYARQALLSLILGNK